MDEEPRTALAALFQIRGREAISEADFVHETSYTLRWFSPKEAQKFLQIGLDRGLLLAERGNLRPSFDISHVAVPVNYRPGPDVLAPPPTPVDLFTRFLTRLQTATGLDRPPLVARINHIQERLGVDAEVAAAQVACTLGVDVADLLPDVEAEVLRRPR